MINNIINKITNNLRFENKQLIGRIYNLEKKLNGQIPITREELFYLVNSWGRNSAFLINGNQKEKITIKKCASDKCYDLSKLDVSQITNMDQLFEYSNFFNNPTSFNLNGVDISNWDVSNVTSMASMFYESYNFNGNISSWNVSGVTNMHRMFFSSRLFNQDISNWDISKVTDMSYMFAFTKNFEQNIGNWNFENIKNLEAIFFGNYKIERKYNNDDFFPTYTEKIKDWFNNNRGKMKEIDIKNIKNTHGKEIDDFFYKINKKNQELTLIKDI